MRRSFPGAALAAPAVAGLAALASYIATLQRTVPAGDSGELITVARTLGVAHPPGYALYTLLGFAWTAVIPWGSVAVRLNLLSAVLAAVSVALVASTARRLTRSAPAGAIAGLTLAWSAPFWKYALVAEVFALNALLAGVLLSATAAALDHANLLGRRPPTGPNEARREGETAHAPWPIAVAALVTTLLLSHHHTLVLLALPVDLFLAAILLFPEKKLRGMLPGFRRPYAIGPGLWLLAAGAALAGLLPLLYYPVAAARGPLFSWGDTRTPEAILRLLLRTDYGTFRLDPLAAGHHADKSHILLYLGSLPRDFAPVGALLVIGGAFLALRKRHPLAGVLAGYLALQLLFFTRVGFPSTPLFFRGVVERFYILPDLVLSLLIGIGAAALLGRFPARRRLVASLALGILSAGVPLLLHHRVVDQRRNTFIEDLNRNILISMPPKGVLFEQGDIFYNGLGYLTLVRGERPDVTVVDQELLTRPWYVGEWRRRRPDLLPPLGATDAYTGTAETGTLRWLDHLYGRVPVAFVGLKDSSYAQRYSLVRRGFVLLAYRRGEEPGVREQALTALALLEPMRLDSFFREYDPWSFEAESRWRITEFAAQTATLLCDPEAWDLPLQENLGMKRLLAFFARNRESGRSVDADLLLAGGLLLAAHPAVRDAAQARGDLARYLALRPEGVGAATARSVLEAIANLPRTHAAPTGP